MGSYYGTDINGSVIVLDLANDEYLFFESRDQIPCSILSRLKYDGTDSIVQKELIHFRGFDEKITIRVFLSIIYSMIWAILNIKILGLNRSVKSVSRMRISRLARGEISLEALVYAYLRVRVLLYRPQDNCLINALALIKVLNMFGKSGKWCFGVRLSPFSAHCWVEGECGVIVDSANYIGKFSRILTVAND